MVKHRIDRRGRKNGHARITDNLLKTDFEVAHVEVSSQGQARGWPSGGLTSVEAPEALKSADVVILAVPDNRIKQVASGLEGDLRPGTMVVVLDAAAPFAGDLPKRDDLVYFVTHPCHPPVYNDEADLEARRDFFGGVKAKQHIVCALMQGPESAYALGEKVARAIYAPVMRSHRVTVDQMAILEPVLSETIGATCVTVIRCTRGWTRRSGAACRRRPRVTSSLVTSTSRLRSSSTNWRTEHSRTAPRKRSKRPRQISSGRTGRRCSSRPPSRNPSATSPSTKPRAAPC